MTLALWAAAGLVGLLVLGLALVRRRTYYVTLERMSDAWIREHVGDPLPEHLR